MGIEDLANARSMTHLIMSYIPARMVYVAAKLELVDQISEAGIAPPDLARKLNLDAGTLRRIMRVLAGLGILHEREDRFFVTAFGETLRKDAPYSVRDWAIYSHELVYSEFADVVPRLRSTGQSATKHRLEYLRVNPELDTIYHTAMSKRGKIETSAIAEAYDFSDCRTIVDVGGGNGALLSGLLISNDKVSAVLFDQKSAIEAAKAGHGGLLPRCEFVAGSFFEAVPSGGDTYFLKRVLVDWSDEEATQIL